MARPEDSPQLQVLLPFLWWGTFNIWSAIQRGKKTCFSENTVTENKLYQNDTFVTPRDHCSRHHKSAQCHVSIHSEPSANDRTQREVWKA